MEIIHNSNTTLVKVKLQMEAFIQESYMQIQIQHLLKLNYHSPKDWANGS